MIVTGNRILDALDFLKERAKTLDAQFQASLYVFEDDESKGDPREIMTEFNAIQVQIAKLQELQAAYNLQVTVEVEDETMSLQRVLQLIAGANRAKSLWAKAAAPEAENPYLMHMGGMRQRTKDNEYARKVVPEDEAQKLSDAATRRALAFKQALRSGNAREVGMEADEALFVV